ncbi:hypothetical protein ATCVNTS1_371L [Acanthocystis turfacea Chlorella virus NTS-1]|nr:hypothetical protein ATCVNTS1_371L [Acanthocystis turfacea Chlorella virus NTS-1]
MKDLYFGPLESTIPEWAAKYYKFQDSEDTPSVEDTFNTTCLDKTPVNLTYIKNYQKCDKIANDNPDKQFRVKMCLKSLSPGGTNSTRWCSMFQGINLTGGPDRPAIMFPEYASCIKNPGGYVDRTQEKCANSCRGSHHQLVCKVPVPAEVTFNQICGPFPFTKYGVNLATCDAIVTGNPAKEFRMNMCAATLAKPAISNPARWCSMYPGNNQTTGKVFPEYARCIKANGMVDMTKPRCANVCKGKPGQNGCPGRPPASK